MSRKRISRALVGLLLVAITLGTVAYFHNTNKSKATEQLKSQPDPAAAANNKTAPVASAAGNKPAPGNNKPSQISMNNLGGPLIGGTPAPAPSPSPSPSPAPTPSPAPRPRPTELSTPAVSTGNALADGKAQIEAGNLVAGRKILNDALVSNTFSGADAQAAKDLIAKANQTLIFSPRRVSDDPYALLHGVKAGEKPMKIAAAYEVTWDFLGRLNNISDPRKLRADSSLKIIRGPFHAVISKSKYTLDLYLGSPGEKGSMYVCTYRVGTGKNNSTPTGTWMVSPQSKLKNPKWWGTADEPAREADDPKNPLGEFWIGLTGTDGEAVGKNGFGIHGTIEPDSIGKEMSHGCIRLTNQDIERIYEMLVEGKSTVIIKE